MHTLQAKESNETSVLVVLSTLFIMWGLITVMNGFLVPQLVIALQLSLNKAMVIAYAFFGTYFFMAFPAGKLIDKVGYKNGIIAGVVCAAIGCFLFYIAAENISYALTVISLFVLASGITILQVGANAYVVLFGKRGKGAQRLTLVQAFNSLGTVAASIFAAKIIANVDDTQALEGYAKVVQTPYLIMGGVLLLVAGVIAFSKLPKLQTAGVDPLIKEKMPPRRLVWEFPHVALGCIAIFAYVGAEISIFQFLLAKMNATDSAAVAKKIETMIEIYWGGLMVGRFIGAGLLSKFSPRKMMTTASLIASALIIGFVIIIPGDPAGNWETSLWLLSAVGLFNSVLFPCIFTMGMDGLGKFSEEASSVLVMSVVGGAVIPFIVFNTITGTSASVKAAFVIVLLCYAFIAFFGFRGSRYEKQTNFY